MKTERRMIGEGVRQQWADIRAVEEGKEGGTTGREGMKGREVWREGGKAGKTISLCCVLHYTAAGMST